MGDDDEFDDFYSDDDTDCDCSDYDTDLMLGTAWCHKCGRSWGLTEEEVKREIEFQADYMAQFEQEREPEPIRCRSCDTPEGVEMRPSYTAYHWDGIGKDPNADVPLCPVCFEEHREYWNEMWLYARGGY